MKNNILIVLLLLGLTANAKKIQGLLIDNGDTTEVVFNIPVYFRGEVALQKIYHHVIIRTKDKVKMVLKPKQQLEFIFNYNDEEYHFLSMPNLGENYYPTFGKPLFDSNIGFMRCVFKGKNIVVANALSFEEVEYMDYTGIVPVKLKRIEEIFIKVMRIGKRSLFSPEPIDFKKEALQYFSGCPEICSMLRNNRIGRNNLIKLAQFYDKECGDIK